MKSLVVFGGVGGGQKQWEVYVKNVGAKDTGLEAKGNPWAVCPSPINNH